MPRAAPWIIVLAIAAAWANSLRGPFVYDDIPSLVLNPTIRHLWPPGPVFHPPAAGGMTVAGRPLLNATFALNYALGGLQPLGYHVCNVAVHLTAALLLFGLVRRSDPRQAGGPLPGRLGGDGVPALSGPAMPEGIALAAALLWALHPLQTESVTYTVQRAESLMGLCYLATLYAFLRGAQAARRWPWHAVAVTACAAGMACKEVMVSAPLIVFVFDAACVSGSAAAAWRRNGRTHLLLAGTLLIVASLVISTHGRGDARFDPGVSWGRYAATQFGAISHYLGLTFWPRPLIFDYGAVWVTRPAAVVPAALLVLLFLAGTAVALQRRPRLGLLGLMFFAILAPTSLVPGARQTLAEHRMYLALAPLAVLAAWTAGRFGGSRGLLAAVGVAAALGAATAQRNRDYRSALVLWGDTAAKRPLNPVAHHNYGMALYERGDLPAAAAEYRRALALQPEYPKAHANLGAALLGMGEAAAGIAEYRTALAQRPDFEDARFCLAEALAGTGQTEPAIAEYRSALALAPNDGPAHLGLARALAQQGDLDAGLAEARAASRCDPASAAPHLEMGKMLAQEGRLREADAELQRVLELEPNAGAAREILRRVRAYR